MSDRIFKSRDKNSPYATEEFQVLGLIDSLRYQYPKQGLYYRNRRKPVPSRSRKLFHNNTRWLAGVPLLYPHSHWLLIILHTICFLSDFALADFRSLGKLPCKPFSTQITVSTPDCRLVLTSQVSLLHSILRRLSSLKTLQLGTSCRNKKLLCTTGCCH